MIVIYEPKGKAREFSPLALNYYNGCDHGCLYCYVPGVVRKPIEEYHKGVTVKKNLLENLKKDVSHRIKKQVLLSFMGDPYCKANDNFKMTHQVLEILLNGKVPTAILTKGGLRCLQDLDLFKEFKQKGVPLKVGQTILFTEPVSGMKWEPGASVFSERLETLKILHSSGIRTFISLEPVIDPTQSLDVIAQTMDFCDEYKIGKLNHFPDIEKTINWEDYLNKVLDVLRKNGKDFYVKEALRKVCPNIECKPEEIDMDRLAVK